MVKKDTWQKGKSPYKEVTVGLDNTSSKSLSSKPEDFLLKGDYSGYKENLESWKKNSIKGVKARLKLPIDTHIY